MIDLLFLAGFSAYLWACCWLTGLLRCDVLPGHPDNCACRDCALYRLGETRRRI